MTDSMDAFEYHIEDVLRFEGGYVNDPNDPGGETNMGISKKSFPSEDIKGMTRKRALHLYETYYWVPAGCEYLPPDIAGMHLDTAVNCGVRQAIKILQRASGVTADGLFGKNTRAAAQKCTPRAYVRERLKYYERVVQSRPDNARYMEGWKKRAESWLN